MGKKLNVAYAAVCMGLCALPFVGMAVAPSESSTDHQDLAPAPSLAAEDGAPNLQFFNEFNAWFDDHFAGRSRLVDMDACIQQGLFGVSSADKVVVGTDGWLYAADSADDYLGQRVMSDRMAFNAANNLSLIQRRAESQGASFLLAVVPNKNSLYGENMPYYLQKKAGETKSLDVFAGAVEKRGIPTVDLLKPFEAQSDRLYLKRDSHWTDQGAFLAYDAMMTELDLKHDAFGTTKIVREKKHMGDIDAMLFPVSAQPEWNGRYQIDDEYSIKNKTDEPEPLLVETASKGKNGSLVMFRDSFGNTLLPFLASQFKTAAFSWNVPLPVDELLEKNDPDVVICESVERKIKNYATEAALMSAPKVESFEAAEPGCSNQAKVAVGVCDFDVSYQCIAGTVDSQALGSNDRVFVRVEHAGKQTAYEAFTVSSDDGDNGFAAYFKQGKIQPGDIVRIFVGKPKSATCVAETVAE